MQLQIEVDLETDGLDCHYCPVDLSIAVPANTTKKVSILCSIGDVNERPAPVSGTEAFSILEEMPAAMQNFLKKPDTTTRLPTSWCLPATSF